MLPRWVDPLLAVVLFAVSQAELWLTSESSSSFRGPVAVSVAATVAYCLAVALRSRVPLAALVGLSLLFAVWLPGFYIHAQQPPFEPAIAAMLVLYSAAVSLSGRRALSAGGSFVAALAISDVPALLAGRDIGNVVPSWVFLALAWALGRAMRRRQGFADQLASRAERAERAREQRAREAVEDERARIARELHDVVTHAVSGIVVQAAAERRALPVDQLATRQVLGDIEGSGREALTELRQLLGILRRAPGDNPLSPVPSLREIDSLVRSSGLPVCLCVEGAPVELPPGLDLAAYRVLQEGLTNTRKHAIAASRVSVVIRYLPDAVELEVIDDGRGAHTPPPSGSAGSGFGLLGLSERVSLHGGALRAAPVSAGGFRLWARLPYTQRT